MPGKVSGKVVAKTGKPSLFPRAAGYLIPGFRAWAPHEWQQRDGTVRVAWGFSELLRSVPESASQMGPVGVNLPAFGADAGEASPGTPQPPAFVLTGQRGCQRPCSHGRAPRTPSQPGAARSEAPGWPAPPPIPPHFFLLFPAPAQGLALPT